MAKRTKKETGKEPGMDKTKEAMYISMAVDDLKKAVKGNSALRQARVYEELESRIGRTGAQKSWPGICKTAKGEKQ